MCELKNIAFYHCCCINNWEIVTDIFFNKLISEKYKLLDEIYVCCVGENREKAKRKFSCHEKIKYIDCGEDIGIFEYPTLEFLWNYCQVNDCKVFYFHTKGVTWTESNFNSSKEEFIRRFTTADMLYSSFVNSIGEFNYKELNRVLMFILKRLSYFCIEKMELHLDFLDKYDTSGVQVYGDENKFYLRNFWFARSDYIKKLPKPQFTEDRFYAEFWLLSKSSVNFFDMKASDPTKYGIFI